MKKIKKASTLKNCEEQKGSICGANEKQGVCRFEPLCQELEECDLEELRIVHCNKRAMIKLSRILLEAAGGRGEAQQLTLNTGWPCLFSSRGTIALTLTLWQLKLSSSFPAKKIKIKNKSLVAVFKTFPINRYVETRHNSCKEQTTLEKN